MNAQTLRQQLTNLSGSTGGHKEQADRYRALLEQILTSTDPNQSEFLKLFIEASEWTSLSKRLEFTINIHVLSRSCQWSSESGHISSDTHRDLHSAHKTSGWGLFCNLSLYIGSRTASSDLVWRTSSNNPPALVVNLWASGTMARGCKCAGFDPFGDRSKVELETWAPSKWAASIHFSFSS